MAVPGTWKGSWKSCRDSASVATFSAPIASANAANAASRSSSVTPGGSGRVDVAEVLLIFSGLLLAAVWVWCVLSMVRHLPSAWGDHRSMVQFVHRSVHGLHHRAAEASGPLPAVLAWCPILMTN